MKHKSNTDHEVRLDAMYENENIQKWWSYEKTKKWARGQGIKNSIKWMELSKKYKLPKGVYSQPYIIYRDEWKGWKEFLGTNFKSYEYVSQWARKQGIKSSMVWSELSKNKMLPDYVPSHPYELYKDKWNGWKEFLGTVFMNYDKASLWSKEQGITTCYDFFEISKPDD